MSKIIATTFAALALWASGCSSPTIATAPTGCTTVPPTDAGASDVCAIEWSCNSDSQHYWIECTLSSGNYACQCSTDTMTTVQTLMVNPFVCNAGGALPVASACGWNIQM